MLFALVLAAATVASASPADSAGDTLDGVKRRGEIAFGADVQGGEPYVFEDPKDPTKLVGFEVDIAWADGKLKEATIRSLASQRLVIRPQAKSSLVVTSDGSAVQSGKDEQQRMIVVTEKGKTYVLKPA